MKATAVKDEKFSPVTVTLVLETQREVNTLFATFNTPTVCNAARYMSGTDSFPESVRIAVRKYVDHECPGALKLPGV